VLAMEFGSRDDQLRKAKGRLSKSVAGRHWLSLI
jgi:hypothetical protein